MYGKIEYVQNRFYVFSILTWRNCRLPSPTWINSPVRFVHARRLSIQWKMAKAQQIRLICSGKWHRRDKSVKWFSQKKDDTSMFLQPMCSECMAAKFRYNIIEFSCTRSCYDDSYEKRRGRSKKPSWWSKGKSTQTLGAGESYSDATISANSATTRELHLKRPTRILW